MHTRNSHNIMTAFDKIAAFHTDIQNEVRHYVKCDLNELRLEFADNDYKLYGWAFTTNILQLNFPGVNNWFYFISIPDDEMDTFKETVDEYPIYFVDFESATIEKESKNYRRFMRRWFPNDKRLKHFSKKCKKQPDPKMTIFSQEMIEHYINQLD